jgi:hypothetical protein
MALGTGQKARQLAASSIHASKPRELFVWPKSHRSPTRHRKCRRLLDDRRKSHVANSTPQGRRWLKRQESTEKPPGEWNTMRIRCEADQVSVWVNGTLMNEGTGLTATQGAICLQSEGAEIHFRKVELTPIE